MRIAHCLNHSWKANGHVAVAVDLACEQAKGHDVTVIGAPGDYDEQLASSGVRVIHVPLHDGPLRVVRMAGALLPHLRRIRPDIVNAHMVTAALAARLVQPFCGFKLVTTVHNSFDRQARLMAVGQRVIAVSRAVQEELEQAGVPAAKLQTVTNGTIGGARRPFLPARTVALQHPAIVSVCGLHERKGVRHLIAAFDQVRSCCPEAHLYLVGEGPEREAYENQAQATASAGHIHFLGFMEDPREVLVDADVFVLASLREPFGLVLSEARQLGKAIVATAVDGVPDVLGGGRRGLLVPPADPEQMSQAIVRLLDDHDLRNRLATAAGQDLDEISVSRMSSRTLSVYAEALGHADPGGKRGAIRRRASARSRLVRAGRQALPPRKGKGWNTRRRGWALATAFASLAVAGLLGTAAFAPAATRMIDLDHYRLSFNEPFDRLDVSAWGPGTRWIAHTPWHGDFGDAHFVDPEPGRPFSISGGLLTITMKGQGQARESGLLSSADSESRGFTQAGGGYFEVRAKLPGGKGVWPAIWLGSNGKPGRPSPEIDIMEYYGHDPSAYMATVHVWRDGKSEHGDAVRVRVSPGLLERGFHRYGVAIDADDVVFYLDRKEVGRLPSRPEYLQPMFMMIDLGAGGGWPVDGMPDPSRMIVDYARAYRASGDPGSAASNEQHKREMPVTGAGSAS